MTKILVLGGGGMLGHKLCQLLPNYGFGVVATLRRANHTRPLIPAVYDAVELIANVDVLNDARLEQTLASSGADVVINCIGIVKQLPTADDRYLSVAINSWLPHRLAKWCGEHGKRLIHISTDCVFDGLTGMYHEGDHSDARDLYGKSKYLGETSASETSAVTLRTSIIGRELVDPGHGLLEWLLAQQGRKIKGFARAIYTGVTTHELARAIVTLINADIPWGGLYQVASAPINKFDLLQLIRRVYGLDVAIERDEQFICDRSMVMDRFAKETGYVVPSWEEMIQEMHADITPYTAWKESPDDLGERWLNHAFRSC